VLIQGYTLLILRDTLTRLFFDLIKLNRFQELACQILLSVMIGFPLWCWVTIQASEAWKRLSFPATQIDQNVLVDSTPLSIFQLLVKGQNQIAYAVMQGIVTATLVSIPYIWCWPFIAIALAASICDRSLGAQPNPVTTPERLWILDHNYAYFLGFGLIPTAMILQMHRSWFGSLLLPWWIQIIQPFWVQQWNLSRRVLSMPTSGATHGICKSLSLSFLCKCVIEYVCFMCCTKGCNYGHEYGHECLALIL
jgi:hypothetical protein